jgi:hypothetical protein
MTDALSKQSAFKQNRMKHNINIKSIILGVALGVVIVLSVGAAIGQKRVEYRHIPTQQSDEALNKLADEGWTVLCTGGSQNGTFFYLLTRSRQ